MSNQEFNQEDLQKIQSINTSRNNIIESIPAKAQTHIPKRPEKAEQLSAAHGARWKARAITLSTKEGIKKAENLLIALLGIPVASGVIITALVLDLINKSIKGEITVKDIMASIKKMLPKDKKNNKSFVEQLEKNEAIINLLEEIKPIVIDYNLSLIYGKENPTTAELRYLSENEKSTIEDPTKTSINDYLDFNSEWFAKNSKLLGILDNTNEITDETMESLVSSYIKSDMHKENKILEEDFKNWNLERIINWGNRFFSKKTKDDSTSSTLAKNTEEKFTYPDPTAKLSYAPIQGKFGNMAENSTQISDTKENLAPTWFGRLGDRIAKMHLGDKYTPPVYINTMEELRASHDAHIQREIANDPSMEYFYSSKYQEEHQNMYSGGASYSNTNPLEANNFSSPVGGSSFGLFSNNDTPLNIPPFLTIDDILKNSKVKQFAQNIASNEAHKQLYAYNQEIYKGFQEESPLTDEDRNTLDDMADLISYLQHEADRNRKTEKYEQERRA